MIEPTSNILCMRCWPQFQQVSGDDEVEYKTPTKLVNASSNWSLATLNFAWARLTDELTGPTNKVAQISPKIESFACRMG